MNCNPPNMVEPDSLTTIDELRLALMAANRQIATQTIKLTAQTLAMNELARETGQLLAMIETGVPDLQTSAIARFRRYIDSAAKPFRSH